MTARPPLPDKSRGSEAGGGGAGGASSPPPLLRPFAGLRPAPQHAAQVLAPPYDVPTAEEARAWARDRPWSFLHVSRAEVDFPPGGEAQAPKVYARAAANLERMVGAGVLARDPVPCYYVYRLAKDGHRQLGLVAAASLAAYQAGRIRRHELTRPDKVEDRARHMTALGANTGPVLLAHRPLAEATAMIEEVAAAPPALAATTADGTEHALWVVSDPPAVDALGRAYEGIDTLYLADGHHRTAAAALLAEERRAVAPGNGEEASHERFPAVAVASDRLRILDYNRVVRDLGGLDAAGLLDALAADFTVAAAPGPVRPGRRRHFAMYLEGRWYRLALREPLQDAPEDDDTPAGRLDVGLLSRHLLEPLLGIGDPRRDPRIDFVGGSRGLGELERRVDSGEMAVAFALHPTSMDDLMAVADAGQLMPPKSTWFDPKLADGLVSMVLD